MAGAESDSGWWSSLLTAAKEKSVSALSATKRDLAEFVSVVSNDTSVAVKHASENIKGLIQIEDQDDVAKQTKSSLSPHLPPSSSSVPPSHPVGVPYDRSQAQLFTLQSSPDTFLTNPLGVESEYERWAGQFEVQSRQSEISQLLVNCPHVRSLHSGLVPAKVSYNDFWKRYFFKLGLLRQEEQRRADLMARVQPQPPPENLAWEELEEAEETVERGEEGERGEEKAEEKDGEEEKSVTEETEAGKNSEERNKDPQNREDDVASSIVEIKIGHLRSESSDSFVCVSEDLPHSDGSSPDGNGGGGDWEYLKMVGGAEEEGGGSGESSEGGDLTATPVKQERGGEEGRKVKRGAEEKEASESSDWESWDD